MRVTWKPFFLDPTLPKAGINKLESYNKKFGPQRVAQMLPMMQRVGAAEGINFSYGGLIANTLDSHRLMEYAHKVGGSELQNKVCNELFSLYFEREGNIGSTEALADAAAKAGMDKAAVTAFLGTDELRREVQEEVQQLIRKYRIGGVPFFVIDGKYKVEGAQEAEAFSDIWEEIGSRGEK